MIRGYNLFYNKKNKEKKFYFADQKLLYPNKKSIIWNVSDWSLEIPALHREKKRARQPIRSGVILINLCYN